MLTFEADLLADSVSVIAAPGQADSVLFSFRFLRGLLESEAESAVFPQAGTVGSIQVSQSVGAVGVLNAASAQGVPVVDLAPGDVAALDGLSLSADAKARITTALQAGMEVIVPASAVEINGQPAIAWLETDPATGETTSVGVDGSHQALIEYAVIIGAVVGTLGQFFNSEYEYADDIGKAQAETDFWTLHVPVTFATSNHPYADLHLFEPGDSDFDVQNSALEELHSEAVTLATAEAAATEGSFLGGETADSYENNLLILANGFDSFPLYRPDPPVPTALFAAPTPVTATGKTANQVTAAASVAAGPIAGQAPATGLSVTGGSLAASWSGSGSGALPAATLAAGGATVRDAAGTVVGTGSVVLSAASPIPVSISGPVSYAIQGDGNLAFYGAAATGLAVSADWNSYTATLTGNLGLTLTTSALTLNGQALPSGTYTITAGSATMGGSGPSTSPVFAGSASVTATGASVSLGPGSGGVMVGGTPLDDSAGAMLTGFTGNIQIGTSGSPAGQATLSGTAAALLQVVAASTTVTADQNTPATFHVNVNTTTAGAYSLLAVVPSGWPVTMDSLGNVTVTPPAGTQGGVYTIEVVAQEESDLSFEAATTVTLTVKPTVPGFALNVQPDPVYTVPIGGAQLPTAFRASIQNLGPAADTYNLTFSNVPTGFTLLDSGTSVTVPAGETGIRGIYLQPNPGQALPAPGTQLSFTVTATSTTDPSITQTQTETFTVPDIDAVTVTASPTALSAIPGEPVTDTLTLTNVGNVNEDNITLTDTLTSGLTLTGLAPVSLAVGQSTTETITLTPSASTPLNSMLQATIIATFGPSASPVTQTLELPVDVVVPAPPPSKARPWWRRRWATPISPINSTTSAPH